MSIRSERLWCALLLMYPRGLRREYGAELRWLVVQLARRPEYQGLLGRVRVARFLLWDAIVTIAREHARHIPWRSAPVHAVNARAARAPYGDALLATLAVLALYVATLAPTVVFWDAGEYLTAAHIRGIPHQPGNPLFVLLAHGWERLLAPLGLPVVVRLNLFSAVLSAGAHFFWFLIAHRALGGMVQSARVRRLGAFAAVLLSASAFSVWNQSNVTEKVYTLSLFTIALVTWMVLRWRDSGHSPRWLLGAVLVVALSSTNHLMGVLVAPAILTFVLIVQPRTVLRPRLWAGALLCVTAGLLPQFYLPYRAAQRPILNENAPACNAIADAAVSVYTWGRKGCPALSNALRRRQYAMPSFTLDPTVYPHQELPRGPALIASQAANYLQYFNWQWGRSIGGRDPLVGGFRPLVTLVFLLLGLCGARLHWRRDRAEAALLGVLFLTLSAGLVTYLNFKYGFSIGWRQFPSIEMHEVRERDYFFLISFSVWGLWSGIGLVAVWQTARQWLRPRLRWAGLATAPVLALAVLPLGLNWRWASRADDYTARDWAYNVLMSVDPYGVLFTNGDNDTFPLWYLQEVEGIRRDVTVMVVGYLNTPWYPRQVRDLTRPCPDGIQATDDATRILCQRPFVPGQMPASLAAAEAPAPEDSVLPLTDQQIDGIAASSFVVDEPLTLTVGNISTTIESGTIMLPADTFVAAIVRASIGERPIHFMTPAPSAHKLGLAMHTVRHGLTFKLLNDDPGKASGTLVRMPVEIAGAAGALIDLSATEALVRVYQRRGRILDPAQPWVDAATASIPLQYAWTHLAAAHAHTLRGNQSAANEHAQQADWWQALLSQH